MDDSHAPGEPGKQNDGPPEVDDATQQAQAKELGEALRAYVRERMAQRDRAAGFEPEDEAKPFDPGVTAEDFMPPHGTFREQTELQIAMLTRALLESAIFSSGKFDRRKRTDAFAKGPQPYERQTHTEEMKTAARMANASAGLMASYARVHHAIYPVHTLRHTTRQDAKGKILGQTIQVTARMPHCNEPKIDPPADLQKKTENEGSNANS